MSSLHPAPSSAVPAASGRRLLLRQPPVPPAVIIRQVLDETLAALRHGPAVIRVPPSGPNKLSPGMHMHPNPEIFLQVSGRTGFDCGPAKFMLHAGELCLMPRYTAHGETASADAAGPFHNLVVSMTADHVSLHLAHADRHGRPRVMTVPERHAHPELCRKLERLADDAVAMGAAGDDVRLGLVWAMLALIRHLLDEPPAAASHRHFKIGQCVQLIHSSLDDPALSVRRLAQAVHCAPDYLSHLFRKETGTRLTDFINRSRITQAKHLLEATPLAVKEVAWSCGFEDPGYFTRLFRRLEGMTPRAWRRAQGLE